MEWSRKKDKNRNKGQEEDSANGKFPIPDSRIQEALKNAGITDPEEKETNIDQYMKQMYSDVQSDKEYRRIHNYASAERNKSILYAGMRRNIWGESEFVFVWAMGKFHVQCYNNVLTKRKKCIYL